MRRALGILGIVATATVATYCAMNYDTLYTTMGHSLALVALILLARWYERMRLTSSEPERPRSATGDTL